MIFFSTFPDVHMAIDYIVASGDTFAVKVRMTGTNTGTMGAIPATNKKFDVECCLSYSSYILFFCSMDIWTFRWFKAIVYI